MNLSELVVFYELIQGSLNGLPFGREYRINYVQIQSSSSLALLCCHHVAVLSRLQHDDSLSGLDAHHSSLLVGEEILRELLQGMQVVRMSEALIYLQSSLLYTSKPLLSVTRSPLRFNSDLTIAQKGT